MAVRAKGTRGTCCCPGHMERPADFEKAQGHLDILQAYCCGCIPKQLCVQFVKNAGTPEESITSQLFDSVHPCNPDTGDRYSVYRGDMPVDGVLTDIDFAWVVENEVCYIAMESYALGASKTEAAYRHEITDYVRDLLCERCQRCGASPRVLEYLEFTTSAGLFRISPAANYSLIPANKCADCCDFDDACNYDDVVAESNQISAPGSEYEDQFCGHCGSCSAVCSCACITIVKGGVLQFTGQACICNHRYQTSNGYSIAILPGETDDCCELVLEATGTDEPEAFQGDRRLKISDSIFSAGGPSLVCPDISHTWDFNDANSVFPENHVQVSFTCMACAECGFVVVDCCTGEGSSEAGAGSVPRILYATVVDGTCCGVSSFPLIFSATEGVWAGSHPDGRCGLSTSLRLSCTGASTGWRLAFTGSPCLEQVVDAYTVQCSPLVLEFDVPAQGLGCCDPSNVFINGTLRIEITE